MKTSESSHKSLLETHKTKHNAQTYRNPSLHVAQQIASEYKHTSKK